MKHPRTVLALAAAALAVPAALATASTATYAGGVIPTVTVDTSSIPPLCAQPELKPTCTTINNTDNQGHTATFSGTYTASNNSFNDTAVNGGTCIEGSKTVGANTCEVSFTGGLPSTLCKPNPSTPWYLAKPGQVAWTYVPATAASSQTMTSDRLFAEGGGVVDYNSVTPQQDGSLLIYRIHIQINSICGNEDAAQGAVDNTTGQLGFGAGTVDLSKTYKFTGYIDVL